MSDKKQQELDYIQLSHRTDDRKRISAGRTVRYGEDMEARKRQRTTGTAEGSRRREAEIRHKRAMERKRRQRRNRLILILVLALIAVTAAAVLLKMKNKNVVPAETAFGTKETQTHTAKEPRSDAEFAFEEKTSNGETPEVLTQKSEDGCGGYALRYPTFGKDTLDSVIRKSADDMIAIFSTESSKGPSGSFMKVDYEISSPVDTVVSVKWNIHKEMAAEDGSLTSSDTIETATYLMEDGSSLGLSDVLTDGYLTVLSEQTKTLASELGVTPSETAAAESSDAYRYFIWSADGLTLYYLPGELAESVQELKSTLVPMDSLKPFLTGALAAMGQGTTAAASTIDPNKPMVCLTFDDGPKASTTPELLDILEANDAHATFFVTGSMLKNEGAEALIRRELELGCQVGNHTMDHENLKTISDDEITQQIEGVNDILKSWGLDPTDCIRPPYGGWNNHVIAYVDYPLVRWNVDTLDWETRDPDKTIYAVLEDPDLKAADGDIILMHDIHPETIEACKTIIPELKKRGFQLVTVEEMLNAKGIPFEAHKAYYNSGHIKTDFGS